MFSGAVLSRALQPVSFSVFQTGNTGSTCFVRTRWPRGTCGAPGTRTPVRQRVLGLRSQVEDADPSPESLSARSAQDEASSQVPSEEAEAKPVILATAGVTLDLPSILREKPHWYLVQTVPGLEDNVRMTLEAKVRNTPSMNDKILQVLVPKLKAMQLSPGGERVEFEEKVFPSYVMVQMILNEETWEFVRSTAYVVQFVGRDRARRTRMGALVGGRGLVQPLPLTETEVQRIFEQILKGSKMLTQELDIQAGDHVRVQKGNLTGHEGVVASVSPVRGKLTVNLRWLGRDVPTEFRFEEVAKIKRKSMDLPAPPSLDDITLSASETSGSGAQRSLRRIPPEERLEALEALSRLDYDWPLLVAMERLDRVPMQALRQYCRAYGLGASGRKVVLMERVREHVIELIRQKEEGARTSQDASGARDTADA
ncbi:hypothetical protein CCYA_CCYA02G0453 [Cyanidiococcus yangmingshanensis]|nr:hypothetical protein CCYA_CCYA02G0453 [Cyanidiococcus yangmingshanensis]